MGNINNSPISKKSGWPWNEEVPETRYQNDKFEWPKISIVTPSFNQGRFIEETIRSILFQNYPNLEYIIIDGGSTDETINIIKQYEYGINFWVTEKDKGQSDAIIKGFNKATGIILNWINSDDILCYDSLFNIAMAFLSNPKANFVHGKNAIMTIDSEPYGNMPHPKDNLKYRYLYEMPYGQQACFFKYDIYEMTGGVNREFKFSMDFELYLKMHLLGANAIQIDSLIGSFRIHNESKTSQLESIMHLENGNAFMTFLFSVGETKKANFLKRIGHTQLANYKVNIQLDKNSIRQIFVKYLQKNIWYYYNTKQFDISLKIAIQIIKLSPINIFNLNYIKLIKDGTISILQPSRTR